MQIKHSRMNTLVLDWNTKLILLKYFCWLCIVSDSKSWSTIHTISSHLWGNVSVCSGFWTKLPCDFDQMFSSSFFCCGVKETLSQEEESVAQRGLNRSHPPYTAIIKSKHTADVFNALLQWFVRVVVFTHCCVCRPEITDERDKIVGKNSNFSLFWRAHQCVS